MVQRTSFDGRSKAPILGTLELTRSPSSPHLRRRRCGANEYKEPKDASSEAEGEGGVDLNRMVERPQRPRERS